MAVKFKIPFSDSTQKQKFGNKMRYNWSCQDSLLKIKVEELLKAKISADEQCMDVGVEKDSSHESKFDQDETCTEIIENMLMVSKDSNNQGIGKVAERNADPQIPPPSETSLLNATHSLSDIPQETEASHELELDGFGMDSVEELLKAKISADEQCMDVGVGKDLSHESKFDQDETCTEVIENMLMVSKDSNNQGIRKEAEGNADPQISPPSETSLLNATHSLSDIPQETEASHEMEFDGFGNTFKVNKESKLLVTKHLTNRAAGIEDAVAQPSLSFGVALCDIPQQTEELTVNKASKLSPLKQPNNLATGVEAKGNADVQIPLSIENGFRTTLFNGKQEFVKKIVADGNCLFRSLSYWQCGHQNNHQSIRTEIVNLTIEQWEDRKDIVDACNPVRKFIDSANYKSVMGADGECGTDHEAAVFAILYNANVAIYENSNEGIIKKLTVTPENESKSTERSTIHLLYTSFDEENKNGHWEVLCLPEANDEDMTDVNEKMKGKNDEQNVPPLSKSTSYVEKSRKKELHIQTPSPVHKDEYNFSDCFDEDFNDGNDGKYSLKDSTTYSDEEYSEEEYSDENSFTSKVNRNNVTDIKREKKITTKFDHTIAKVEVAERLFTNKYGKSSTEIIREGLQHIMLHTVGILCSLRFYGGIRSNSQDKATYAFCRDCEHGPKYKFLLDCNVTECTVSVHILSNQSIEDIRGYKHKRKFFKQVRGSWRDEIKEKLSHMSPIAVVQESVKNNDIELARDGHMQNLIKLPIAQKISSEARCSDNLNLDNNKDLADAVKLFLQHVEQADPFFRNFDLPLTAVMYTKQDLEIANEEKRRQKKGLILHLDATGSIGRMPKGLPDKQIYYYTGVVKLQYEILELFRMITSEHGVSSISTWLKRYKHFAVTEHKWPLVSAVVVDWSWAFIISVLHEWNAMNVEQYLNIIYKYCEDSSNNVLADIILVKICYAHFMKIVSRTIMKKYKNLKGHKTMILEIVAALSLSRKLQRLDEIFTILCRLLLTKNKKVADDAIMDFGKIIGFNTVNVEEFVNVESGDYAMDEEHQEKSNRSVYATSPFYQRYNYMMAKVQVQFEDEEREQNTREITNPYYCPTFAAHFLTYWMPYPAFWASLDLEHIDQNISRLTNAYVESTHKVNKERVVNDTKNTSIGNCIRLFDAARKEVISRIHLNVDLKVNKSSKQPKYPEVDPSPCATEKWGRGSKARKSKGHVKAVQTQKLCAAIKENKKKTREIVKTNITSTQDNDADANDFNAQKLYRAICTKKVTNRKATKDNTDSSKETKVTSTKAIVREKAIHKNANENAIENANKSRIKSIADNRKRPTTQPTQEKTKKRKEMKDSIHKESDNFKNDDELCNGKMEIVEIKREPEDHDAIQTSELLKTVQVQKEQEESVPRNDIETSRLLRVEEYPNGVISNPQYYESCKSRYVLIARYFTQHCLTRTTFEVRAEYFVRVFGHTWLNGVLIDAYMAACSTSWKEEVTFLTTDDTITCLGDRWKDGPSTKVRTMTKPLKDIVLMVYLYQMHWRLFVINNKEKTVSLLDPYKDGYDGTRVKRAFNSFIKECEPGSSFGELQKTQFRFKMNVPRPHQSKNDGHSCGCFNVYYADCIGRGVDFDMNLNILDYRGNLSKSYLLLSDNLTNVCLHCNKDTHAFDVRCDRCHRRCHTACAFYSIVPGVDYVQNADLIIQLSNETEIPETFICLLCKSYAIALEERKQM